MEWTVVVVVISLVGLVAAVSGPIVKMTSSITKLTSLVDACEKDLSGIDRRNSETHARIFKEIEKDQGELKDHEGRIVKLESGGRRING